MPSLPYSLAALSCLFALTGCSQNDFFSGAAAVAAANPSLPPYHAYGDSITAGFGLSSPGTTAYPAVFAKAENLSASNYAISGDEACDIPTRQIFPNRDDPTATSQSIATVLIGTNDVAVKGVGSYEAVFSLCHQATLAWLATPAELKVSASSATAAGPTHIDTTAHYNAVTTDAQNASLTFSFTLGQPGAVYVWYRIVDDNAGTFSWALDGSSAHSLTTAVSPAMATQNGTKSSLALLRLPAVPAGGHRLVLIQTSAGASGMGIVALGIPPAGGLSAAPRVLAGTVPPQLAGSTLMCSYNPGACQQYSADITANVNLLASDGLNIQLFTSGKYMSATAADLNDALHPNVLGNQEIAHAVEDIY